LPGLTLSSKGENGMSEVFREELDQALVALREELQDKQRGYVTEVVVAPGLFPEIAPPKVEVVLLDPEERRVAFRRTTDPLRGEGRGDWYVGELEEVIEDIHSWEVELEEMEGLLEESYEEEFES
jgi:hypothetical protein